MSKDWSMPLEGEEYENNLDLLLKDALKAVENTDKGCFVNLVTAGCYGNPEEYLSDLLRKEFGEKIEMKYIDQCGCGGYVLRVTKLI